MESKTDRNDCLTPLSMCVHRISGYHIQSQTQILLGRFGNETNFSLSQTQGDLATRLVSPLLVDFG